MIALYKKTPESLKYKILTFFRYFGDAFFYPFFALHLQALGFTKTNIGFILALIPIISAIVHPFYGYFTKNIELTKKCLMVVGIVESVLILALGFTTSFPIIILIVCFMALFGASHYSMLDTLLSAQATAEGKNYSTFRVWGSIAYIIATTIAGWVINISSYQVSFTLACIFFNTSAVLYLFLKKKCFNASMVESQSFIHRLKSVLSAPDVIAFSLFFMLLMGTNYASDNFLGNYFQSRGVTVSQYGLIFSYQVCFEVATLFLLSKFAKKFKSSHLLLLSVICLIVRLLANGFYLPLPISIAMVAFRGIGYGIVLATAYQFISKLVPEENSSISIMVMLFFYALYVSVFNIFNGYLIDTFSFKTFYFVNTGLAFITLLLALWRIVKERKLKNVSNVTQNWINNQHFKKEMQLFAKKGILWYNFFCRFNTKRLKKYKGDKNEQICLLIQRRQNLNDQSSWW